MNAAPPERDDAGAIFEFGSGVDGAEGKLGPAVIADLEIGRFDKIEIVAIPKIGLEDPPPANQFARGWASHDNAAIALRARTKLSAATAQSTLGRPLADLDPAERLLNPLANMLACRTAEVTRR